MIKLQLCAANRVKRANEVAQSVELQASDGILQRKRLYSHLSMFVIALSRNRFFILKNEKKKLCIVVFEEQLMQLHWRDVH